MSWHVNSSAEDSESLELSLRDSLAKELLSKIDPLVAGQVTVRP